MPCRQRSRRLSQALTYFDSSTNNPTPLQRTIAVTVNDGLTGTDTENVLSAPTSPRNTAPAELRELVDRLLSQVEALKSEVRELTEAQQQPAHAIAAIEAENAFAPSAARILVLRPRCAVVRARERT